MGEEYSLNSLFNQKFQDFELFLVNDGSTDGTWSLVQRLCEPHRQQIVLISHDNNLRIPTRRNEAISLAQGRYLAVADGDDFSFDYRFQGQVPVGSRFGKGLVRFLTANLPELELPEFSR